MRFDVAGIDDAGDGSQSRAAALRGSRGVGGDEGFGVGVNDVPVEYVLRLQCVALLLNSPRHEISLDETVLRVRAQVWMGEQLGYEVGDRGGGDDYSRSRVACVLGCSFGLELSDLLGAPNSRGGILGSVINRSNKCPARVSALTKNSSCQRSCKSSPSPDHSWA